MCILASIYWRSPSTQQRVRYSPVRYWDYLSRDTSNNEAIELKDKESMDVPIQSNFQQH